MDAPGPKLVPFVAIHWTDSRLPETVPSAATISHLADGEGFRAGLNRTLVLTAACLFDPDPSRWGAVKVGPHSIRVEIGGRGIVVTQHTTGAARGLTLMLEDELAQYRDVGFSVVKQVVADPAELVAVCRRGALN